MNTLKIKKSNCSSIYKCILPLFYISKILGLAPFSIPPKKYTLSARVFHYLTFLLILCLHLYLIHFNIISTHVNYETDSKILNICGRVSVYWILVFSIISLVVITICGHKISKILKLINECDVKLLSIGADIKFNKHFKCIKLYVIINGGFCLIAQFISGIEINVRMTIVDRHIFLTYFLSHVIHWIVISQFLLLIIAVKTRFEALNVIFW